MQVFLNIKGEKLPVDGLYMCHGKFISAHILDSEEKLTIYYDSKNALYVPEDASVINLNEALEFTNANKQIVEDLNQLIEDSKQHLASIGKQIIQEVLVHDGFSWSDNSLPNLAKEYKECSDYIDGIVSALEVVKRDKFKRKEEVNMNGSF